MKKYREQLAKAQSNAGKSTTVLLLFRLYNLDRPRDLVDDHTVTFYREFDVVEPVPVDDSEKQHNLAADLMGKFCPAKGSGRGREKMSDAMWVELGRLFEELDPEGERMADFAEIVLTNMPALIPSLQAEGKGLSLRALDERTLVEVYNRLCVTDVPPSPAT